MTGTHQGCDNHTRVSRLWDWGGTSPHEGKQKAMDIYVLILWLLFNSPPQYTDRPINYKQQSFEQTLKAIYKKSTVSVKHADLFGS